MNKPARIAIRLVAGTVLYILVMFFSAHSLAVTAGLLLTFPALNGLGLLSLDRGRVLGVTETMIWMPWLNGILCLIYLIGFQFLGSRGYASTWAVLLFMAISVIWFFSAQQLSQGRSFSIKRPVWFSAISAILGVALVLLLIWFTGIPEKLPVQTDGAMNYDFSGYAFLKISSFFIVLLVFNLLAEYYQELPEAILGVVSGFPIVPFGGLLAIVLTHAQSMHQDSGELQEMALGIAFSPVLPVIFIVGFSTFLRVFDLSILTRWIALIVGWMLVGSGIWGVSALFNEVLQS